MRKILESLSVVIMLLILLYIVAARFAPAWLAEASIHVASPTVWSDAAKREQPVAYLRDTKQRLHQQQQKLGQIIADIRKNTLPLEQHIRDHQEELAKTSAFLNEGRAVYQQALATADSQTAQVINFAGRVYPNLTAFKSQLALLHTEKSNKTELLETANLTKQRLSQQLHLMLAQSSKTQMAISEIEPRIMIAEAAQASYELDGMISAIDEVTDSVLNGSEQVLQDYNPIGLTKDLLESSRQQQVLLPNTDASFEAFLSSGT